MAKANQYFQQVPSNRELLQALQNNPADMRQVLQEATDYALADPIYQMARSAGMFPFPHEQTFDAILSSAISSAVMSWVEEPKNGTLGREEGFAIARGLFDIARQESAN